MCSSAPWPLQWMANNRFRAPPFASSHLANVRGFYGGSSSRAVPHLVEGNWLDNSLRYGIHVTGDNGRVRRNAVYDTGGATGVSAPTTLLAYADVVDNDVQGAFAATTPSQPTRIVADGGSGNTSFRVPVAPTRFSA